MNQKILTFLLTCCFATSLSAQNWESALKTHFKSIQKAQTAYLDKEVMETLYQESAAISYLEKYAASEKAVVQTEAVRLIAQIGPRHEDANTRKQAVNLLLEAAMTEKEDLVRKVGKRLSKFQKNDFDKGAKFKLTSLINSKVAYLDEYLKIAGFLQLSADLEALRGQYKKGTPEKAALSMALMRSGDELKLESLMTKVAELSMDDDFIYGVAPILVYIRQKAATDFLLEIVMRDEKDCRPAGADVGGKILCAYRVMEMVAPIIKDFPVAVDEATGDLEVEDYEEALVTVRQWIEEHKGDYELRGEIY